MLKILVSFTTARTTTTTITTNTSINISSGIFILGWKLVHTVQECLFGYCEIFYVSKQPADWPND